MGGDGAGMNAGACSLDDVDKIKTEYVAAVTTSSVARGHPLFLPPAEVLESASAKVPGLTASQKAAIDRYIRGL